MTLILVGSTASAQTQQFYTVNATTDRLKVIDTAGTVTDVPGAGLGFDAINTDLAWHQGTLYGLDGDRLYTISTSTGQATLFATVSLGPGNPTPGEALASDGVNLYAAVGFGNLSATWGTIDLTGSSTLGEITAVGSFVSDCDGAGFDGASFWMIDLFVQGDNQNNAFYSGHPTPSTFAHKHNAYPSFTVLDENDVVASVGTSLYTVTTSGYLTEYVRATGGGVSAVQLLEAGNYRGLEVVPEPTSLVAALGGLCAMVYRRRFRAR